MMDAAATPAAVAGSSSEVTTPAAYEDDSRHGHFAITTSLQIPKSTTSITSVTTPSQSPEVSAKDLKSMGTRFHEDCHESDAPSLRVRSSRLFRGKEQAPPERQKKMPLRLLDLPIDILKDIVKEVTHTNDLTSLALCHSALHRLTIPHIYSRFDIVWPDSSAHAEPRSGVDALTYGLATLVMAEEVFGEAPSQRVGQTNRFSSSGTGHATEMAIRRRRGNHYAHFTKKFSLGNGPVDWVQEYLITKEGGKMLGTLVALAIARMRSLETFVWDMPTGILRDVWLALSSLGDRNDGMPCRLEKVWVRWHDNASTEPQPPPPQPVNFAAAVPLPPLQTSNLHPPLPQIHLAALDRVEHPSFSILPPLKSLSVLDIDELAYLDEMAVLIGKSLDKLRELRVGIARHVLTRDWVKAWEGEYLQQVDADYPAAGSLTIGEKRLGGVLGTLSGFVCDIRKPKIALSNRIRSRQSPSRARMSRLEADSSVPAETSAPPGSNAALSGPFMALRDMMEMPEEPERETGLLFPPPSPISGNAGMDSLNPISLDVLSEAAQQDEPLPSSEEKVVPLDFLDDDDDDEPPSLENVLRLESLELERVPISVPVLQRAIDWSRITSLTLLHCPNHEQLWKTLRRTLAPTPKSPTYPSPRRPPSSTPRKGGKAASLAGEEELEYKLNLKKVHTNTVSPALISFLKETLAPNSLEVLFLQEARSNTSSVAIDAIFRGPLRRHRGSLKKILIDSSEKSPDGLHANSSRWRRWMLSREILAFICSGKMPALRELGMAIDYRDWHFFLQHLPTIPHLRSLYLPFLADHVHGANADPRELALQIVDIVALRPEVQLCYMGIANKCFEILENRREWDVRPESQLGGVLHAGTGAGSEVPASDEDDGEGEDDEDVADEVDDADADHGDDEDDDEDNDHTESDDDDDAEDEEDEYDDTDSSEFDGAEGKCHAARLRLREILFYDDKVAIFKARHGRL